MTDGIIFRALGRDDCASGLLDSFVRFQRINRCWRCENGVWALKDEISEEDWSAERKAEKTRELARCVSLGGAVLGAYCDGALVGFAVLPNRLFGGMRYIQLSSFHVSAGFRSRGIGKKLFAMSCGEARRLRARRLYISAAPAEETVAFYLSLGCHDAGEIDAALYESEPLDRHLEYILR